ncbi:hypothetical protein BPAE_0267g00030 [Botrytis paeoniae]|uniref:Uncharacterized protein n=1 Tax=Botrytis paeoniae TaxID=278948 RepID=A0A4Z1FDA2_9HELO|nr:hypothetical protein BPAE_0267g00030 [Botrytis paeoniae]
MRSDGHVVNRELFVSSATTRPGKIARFRTATCVHDKFKLILNLEVHEWEFALRKQSEHERLSVPPVVPQRPPNI